jgi:hypothetical protein
MPIQNAQLEDLALQFYRRTNTPPPPPLFWRNKASLLFMYTIEPHTA